MRWNICAGVRRSTPSFEVVQTEQSRDLFQKRWRIIACMCGNILYRLIYSGVLQSAQFYLFMWLFWRTPSTLKLLNQVRPWFFQSHLMGHICLIYSKQEYCECSKHVYIFFTYVLKYMDVHSIAFDMKTNLEMVY